MYEITSESWNPSGIENWTEDDIRATAEVFGFARDDVTIDPLGRVFCNGEKIGQAVE